MLSPAEVPLMRNGRSRFEPLERLFGNLDAGCSFGESCMLGSDSTALGDK